MILTNSSKSIVPEESRSIWKKILLSKGYNSVSVLYHFRREEHDLLIVKAFGCLTQFLIWGSLQMITVLYVAAKQNDQSVTKGGFHQWFLCTKWLKSTSAMIPSNSSSVKSSSISKRMPWWKILLQDLCNCNDHDERM